MTITFWLILLTAFIGQTVFLILTLAITPLQHKQSNRLLLLLLIIILCILVSNSITASNLYRKIFFVAQVTRGMVLLLGPIIYLYIRSTTNYSFTLKWQHLLHFVPYILLLSINTWNSIDVPDHLFIAAVEELIAGKSKLNAVSLGQFILYPIHILSYIIVSYLLMRSALKNKDQLMITSEQRTNWINIILMVLLLNTIVFIGISIYTLATGTYGIQGNIYYTIALSLFIYVISYQAIQNNKVLAPGFDKKYKSIHLDSDQRKTVLDKIQYLMETEKVFTDAGLTLHSLSELASIHPNLLSHVINDQLKKTFTELINTYRIEEFKLRVKQVGHEKYSIAGIATEIGYKSKSAFHAAFKKQTGLTPLQYIESGS